MEQLCAMVKRKAVAAFGGDGCSSSTRTLYHKKKK
jgi:hypothetical protein